MKKSDKSGVILSQCIAGANLDLFFDGREGYTILYSDSELLEINDFPGFGKAFIRRFVLILFDMVFVRLSAYFARGGIAYCNLHDIPDFLLDFMDYGGSMDGFKRRYRAWKRLQNH